MARGESATVIDHKVESSIFDRGRVPGVRVKASYFLLQSSPAGDHIKPSANVSNGSLSLTYRLGGLCLVRPGCSPYKCSEALAAGK